MRPAVLCALALTSLSLAMGLTPVSHAVEVPSRTVRFAFDLGSYRGYWRIENARGVEISHDECFIQRVCRETFKNMPEGDYALVLSKEPQSAPIRFKLSPGALTVTSGSKLAQADGTTLRVSGLRKVVFDTSSYRGAWSLDLWKGAEATGFFKRDGQSQTVELFPDTTYTLNIGPFAAERFQIGRDDRIVLIDDSGVVRISPDAGNRLVFQTIDAAFYPVPQADTAQWSIEGLPPPEGRAAFTGARILRLVQGATYKVLEPPTGADAAVGMLVTGKACNMLAQTVKLVQSTLSVMPIPASCSIQSKPVAEAETGLLRRNKAP
jgi:hypothetical protein